MIEDSSNTGGVSKGWDLASLALTGAIAGGVGYVGYQHFKKKKLPEPKVADLTASTSTSNAGATTPAPSPIPVPAGIKAKLSVGAISPEDALYRVWGIPDSSKKRAWESGINTISSLDIMAALKSEDNYDPTQESITDFMDFVHDRNRFGKSREIASGEWGEKVRYTAHGGKPYTDVLKGPIGSRSYRMPISTGPATLSIAGLSTRAQQSLDIINSRIRAAGTSMASFWGQDVILPGVSLSIRSSKGRQIESFESFLGRLGKNLLGAAADEGWRKQYGFSSKEAAIEDIFNKLTQFSTRAVRPSSNMTGALGYKERTAVLDIAQSMFLGDKELYNYALNAPNSLFSGFEGRELTSIMHGTRVTVDEKTGVRRIERLGHLEWAAEPLLFEKDTAALAGHASLAGINHPQLAKGFYTTSDPDSSIAFGFLQPASRRVDELTQMGLTIPRFITSVTQGLRPGSSEALKSAMGRLYIKRGLSLHTNDTLNNLNIQRAHSRILGAEKGFMGFTGLAANVHALDVLDETGKIDLLKARSLYSKVKHLPGMPSEEEFIRKVIPTSLETFQGFAQGIVSVGASLPEEERLALMDQMGMVRHHAQRVEAYTKGMRFILPKDIEEAGFKGGSEYNTIRKILGSVRAYHGPSWDYQSTGNVSTTSDKPTDFFDVLLEEDKKLKAKREGKVSISSQELYDRIFSGEENDALQQMGIKYKPGDIIAFGFHKDSGEVVPFKIHEEGILLGIDPRTEYKINPMSAKGFDVIMAKHEALTTGTQVSYGITGHATAYLEYMRSAGRFIGSSGLSMDPLFIAANRTSRESGQFVSRYVDKAVHTLDFMDYFLSKNNIRGIKHKGLTKFNRARKIAKAINKHMGFEYASAEVFEDSVAGLKFADVPAGILAKLRSEDEALPTGAKKTADRIADEMRAIIAGDIDVFKKHLTAHVKDKRQASNVLSSLESVLKGGPEYYFDPKTGVLHLADFSFQHLAHKSTSIRDLVSNMGEAGVYGGARSSKWHIGAVRAAMMHAAPGAEREAIKRHALNFLIAGSRVNMFAGETAGMMWATTGESSSIYEALSDIYKNMNVGSNIKPGSRQKLLNIEETLEYFTGLKRGETGVFTSAMSTLGSTSESVLNISHRVHDTIVDIGDRGFIFDVSKYGITAKALLPESEKSIPNIKQLYLSPLSSIQPFGKDERGHYFFGNLKRAQARIITNLLGDRVDTDDLQRSVDDYYKAIIGLQSGKTGRISSLQFGTRAGLGGNMAVTTNVNEILKMHLAYAENAAGRHLAENDMALFVKRGEEFVPLDKRMTAILSGQAIHGNAEAAIHRETGGTAEAVYAYTKGAEGLDPGFVQVGSHLPMYHQRAPTTKEWLSIIPQDTIILHQNRALRKYFGNLRGGEAYLPLYEGLLKNAGLIDIWKNKNMMYVDQVIQKVMSGDMDGDARQLLHMGYMHLLDKHNKEMLVAQANRIEVTHSSMIESMQRMLSDEGFYELRKRAADLQEAMESSSQAKAIESLDMFKIHAFSVLGKERGQAAEDLMSRLVQKVFTGRADVFARERAGPLMDLMAEEFDLDALINKAMHYKSDFSGRVTGRAAFTESELAALRSFAAREGVNAGSAFAGYVASTQHAFIQTVINKGHANALLAMAVMESEKAGSDLSNRANVLYHRFIEASTGWTALNDSEKGAAIEDIFRSVGTTVKQAYEDKDFIKRYGEVKDIMLAPFDPANVEKAAKYKKDLRKGIEKAASEGGQEWAEAEARAAGESPILRSGMAKIMIGLEKTAAEEADALGYMRGSAEKILGLFKNYHSRTDAPMSVLSILSEMKQKGDLNVQTILDISQFKNIYSRLSTESQSTLRQQITDVLSSENHGAAKAATGKLEATLEEQASKLKRLQESMHVSPGYLNDITQIASTGIDWANAWAKQLMATSGTAEHGIAAEARSHAADNFRGALLESWHSGRGKVMASAGGVMLGLGIAAHLAGAASSQNISLDREAPLPRRIPLDDLALADKSYEKGPPLNVRVTDGGITPARATIDTTYTSEMDPKEAAALMSTQTAVGQGTVVINDYDSFNRQGNRRYQEQQANSRF